MYSMPIGRTARPGGRHAVRLGRDQAAARCSALLGGGKRLFDGFAQSLDLEHLWVRQSPFATFIHYRVKP